MTIADFLTILEIKTVTRICIMQNPEWIHPDHENFLKGGRVGYYMADKFYGIVFRDEGIYHCLIIKDEGKNKEIVSSNTLKEIMAIAKERYGE